MKLGLLISLGIYLSFCILVAYVGRRAFIGFWGVFVMSILLTPLLTAILIVLLRPRRRKKRLEDYDLDEFG